MARKVLINLATGLEDPERVTVAFLVGGAALGRGATVAMWLTKEAVRLALPGHAEAVACDGCPPLSRLFEQYTKGGGQLLVCPICWNARRLDENGMVANATATGATPMFEWIGDDDALIFSLTTRRPLGCRKPTRPSDERLSRRWARRTSYG